MKKFLALLLVSVSLTTFADENTLTFGETLTLYFSEIFPSTTQETDDIVIKYSDIGPRHSLRSALQRGVYYGMMPNTDGKLTPDTPMTDRAFSQMLSKHFGVKVTGDSSSLTKRDYHEYMQSIRNSYVYKLLQSINQDSLGTLVQPSSPDPSLVEADKYHILDDVYGILKTDYLRESDLSDSDLVYAATEGLVNQLKDPYTQFFRPDDSTDFYNSLEGKIAGIGVIINNEAKGGLLVTDVVDNSPAEAVGILPLDIIVKIGSVLVTTEDGIADDISLLRGRAGTKVEITLVSDKKVKVVTLTRALISVPLVETEIFDNAFYLKYREVAFDSDDLIGDALTDFLESGKKRLILDLRDNPGGSMLETRNILNFFIDQGNPLVVLKYADSEIIHQASQKRMTDWSDYEFVILINKNTASAAEVITTVMREYFPKNLIIIGEKSYGKGTVQELIPFSDNSLLKYTIAEWLTPKNKTSINVVGIKPDKVVPFDAKLWRTKKIDIQLLAGQKYQFNSPK